MNTNEKKTFIMKMSVIVVLILVGMSLIASAFTQYGQEFLNNQDEQLFYLAQAVDRNTELILETYETDLNYVTRRRGFLEAEEIWRETGETEDLEFRLGENIVAQNEKTSSMIAIYEDEVFLSTNGNTAYSFIENAGTDTLKYCTDEEENIYLAFVYDAGGGLEYAALMNMNDFYNQIIGNELAKYDWVILTDQNSEILLYHQQGNLKVEKMEVDAVSGATCGQEGVNILFEQQREQVIGTSSYEYVDSESGENYTARMVTLPTEKTENKVFAIGVVTNYEDVIKILQEGGIKLLCYGGLIAAGVILLFRQAIQFKRRNDRDLKELQVLREKNEMMEELNRKNQELAHHQRLQIIGTLTSGIAHEFNNLLTPIMGYSMMTLEQLPMDNESLYDNVLEIYNASRKAKEITARLSELSRKNTASSFREISLRQLVGKIQDIAMPALPPGVQVEIQNSDVDCTVMGNETQLSQMVLNLMLNAFQAMEEKGGKLTISVNKEAENAVLCVKDTGPGIPKDILENIFDPFFTTKETGKGTGLGLAIVQQVVSEHQGEIHVETIEGEGSEFWVKLPLKPKIE